MKFILILSIIFSLISFQSITSQETSVIYLFPGQGADYRLFDKLEFGEQFDTVHIHLPVPNKYESLPEYANRFLPLIDTSKKIILLGVSLGGMICIELSTQVNAEKVIIISSAKNRNELPGKFTFQRHLPINKIIPKNMIKRGALFMQPRYEPASIPYGDFFTSMLNAKDPAYLKRTIDMIINWKRTESPINIIHIHGENDNTIPIKNVKANYIIPSGSHMMVYTKATQVNLFLNEVLKKH